MEKDDRADEGVHIFSRMEVWDGFHWFDDIHFWFAGPWTMLLRDAT